MGEGGKMKIYIVGTGGVGGYFGGVLARAGNAVTFVARGDHLEAIRQKGLKIKSVKGDFEINPDQVVESIADIKEPDLVIFTVKTYHTGEAAKELAKVATDDTVTITFQNGVDNDDQIKKYVKKGKVYPGVAYIISTKTQPGVIEQTGGMCKLIFGDRDNPHNAKLEQIEKTMVEAGVDATASDDITRDLWNKFMFIVAFSGMTAVCRSPIGKVLDDPLTKSLYENCVKEAVSVAKAMDVNVPDNAFEAIMRITENTACSSKSSLLVDIESGRNTEIEALNGTLTRFAQKYNIDVPINKVIYGAVKLLS